MDYIHYQDGAGDIYRVRRSDQRVDVMMADGQWNRSKTTTHDLDSTGARQFPESELDARMRAFVQANAEPEVA